MEDVVEAKSKTESERARTDHGLVLSGIEKG